MDTRVEAAGVSAQIQAFGCMTTAEFRMGGRTARPLYAAPWHDYHGDPFLEHLRGDFLCVPFGIAPESLVQFPEGWRELTPGQTQFAHGYSANATWELVNTRGDAAEFQLRYPEGDAVEYARRTVACAAGTLRFEDRFFMRKNAGLPLGLHPIFRLPEKPGGATLHLPRCATLAAFPVHTDTSSILRPGAFFDDPARAPLESGGSIDLTCLPLAENTEELALLCNVHEPCVHLDNREEGYRVTLEWDADYLKHCMLWISNRGRTFAPWSGRNLCLGIEPVTSAFDLGAAVSAAANPLAARGVPTSVALEAGRTYTIRHSISVAEI